MYEALDLPSFDDIPDVVRAVPPAAARARATRLVLIGGFAPRRCGIATFTTDTYNALRAASPDVAIDVYAMAPANAAPASNPLVRAYITAGNASSFAKAADMIEASGADAVWLQHEFGLFGGIAGDAVLDLVDTIAAPLIVTLHTVLPQPDPDQRRVMARLVARASKLIVMSERSRQLLRTVYDADAGQIAVIAHGVPDRPFGRSAQFKPRLGFAGRQVLLTFGLLSPGKGIEAVIEAMPQIVTAHPGMVYCVAGATHPNLLATEGEAYRERLQALAVSLGVADHIRWIDAFLDPDELLDLIEAADVYVTPYPGAQQSTSGTLAYAMALGKAVVSTPYLHAAELLAEDHGVLVPFDDTAALGTAVCALLGNPDLLLTLQRRAYARGRETIWPVSAARSLALIENCRGQPGQRGIPARIGLHGLLRICDDTGILQHSVHDVPDRAHGYCVDDNARALMLMSRLGADPSGEVARLTGVFAAFVQHAWNPDRGEFRNFMGFGRHWLEDVGSEDSCGRTLWALGFTARNARSAPMRRWARGLFEEAGASALEFGSPRAVAFAMLGADDMLAADADHPLAARILDWGTERLLAQHAGGARPGWYWFENILAYDNCRLSEAMLRAGARLGLPDASACGLGTLEWITKVQIAPRGHFRPVGSESFGRPYTLPRPFDQQPVEAWAMIDAAAAAYDVTADPVWARHARRAYDWFGGRNDRGVVVADQVSGTCRDGINPRGINRNEGAESVLAWQHATCAIRDLSAKTGQN